MNPFFSHEAGGSNPFGRPIGDLRTNFWEITVPASLAPMRKASVGNRRCGAGIGKGVAGHAAARSDRSRPGSAFDEVSRW
jgi:hypothetical protein